MAAPVIIYGDLNCPYCFALNERLDKLQPLSQKIEWRYVQQDPFADTLRVTAEDLKQLSDKVADVKVKSPTLDISLPTFVPNTKLAISILTKISETDTDGADRFRSLILKAYFQNNADISNIGILEALADRAKVDIPELDETILQQMDEWQKGWAKQSEEGRLPIVMREGEKPLRRTPNTQELLFFLNNIDLSIMDDSLLSPYSA